MEIRYAIIQYEGPLTKTECSRCSSIYPRQVGPEVTRLVASHDALVVEPLCWGCAAQKAPLLQDMVLLTRKTLGLAFEPVLDIPAAKEESGEERRVDPRD